MRNVTPSSRLRTPQTPIPQTTAVAPGSGLRAGAACPVRRRRVSAEKATLTVEDGVAFSRREEQGNYEAVQEENSKQSMLEFDAV